MVMTTLVLIRHGESEANNKGFFAGQYDAPLMPKGKEQAEKTAEYIFNKYKYSQKSNVKHKVNLQNH